MTTNFFLQIWAGWAVLLTITTGILLIATGIEKQDRKITQRWWRGRSD